MDTAIRRLIFEFKIQDSEFKIQNLVFEKRRTEINFLTKNQKSTQK